MRPMHSWIADLSTLSSGSSSSDEFDPDFDERISDIIADTCGGRRRQERRNSPEKQSRSRQDESASAAIAHQQENNPNQRQENSHQSQQQNHSRRQVEPVKEHREQQNGDKPRQDRQHELSRPVRDGLSTPKHHQNRSMPRQSQLQQKPQPAGRPSSTSTAAPSPMPSSAMGSEECSFERHFRDKLNSHPQPGGAARKLNRLVNLPFRAQFGPESRVQSSRELEQLRAGSSLKPSAFTPLLKDGEPGLALHDSPRDMHTQVQQQQFMDIQPQPQPQQERARPIQGQDVRAVQRQQPTVEQLWQRRNQATQTPPLLHSSPPPRLPSPSPPFQQPHRAVNRQHQQNPTWQHRPRTRSHSMFDYGQPQYDLIARRPWVAPPINVDAWALPADHYQRAYLDGLVKRIRESKQRNAKLKSQLERFDRQNKQELDEWELQTREHELDVRRRLIEERQRAQEDLERRAASSQQAQPPQVQGVHGRSSAAAAVGGPVQPAQARPTSILKRPQHSTSAARVAFRSPPIRSVNTYTPNQSGADSFLAPVAEEQENRSNANNATKTALPKPSDQNNPAQQQRNYRVALQNRTNQPQGGRQRLHATSSLAPSPNVHAEREREGQRLDYVARWHQQQAELRQAKSRNPRISLRSNPNSIFHHVPAQRTTNARPAA